MRGAQPSLCVRVGTSQLQTDPSAVAGYPKMSFLQPGRSQSSHREAASDPEGFQREDKEWDNPRNGLSAI